MLCVEEPHSPTIIYLLTGALDYERPFAVVLAINTVKNLLQKDRFHWKNFSPMTVSARKPELASVAVVLTRRCAEQQVGMEAWARVGIFSKSRCMNVI